MKLTGGLAQPAKAAGRCASRTHSTTGGLHPDSTTPILGPVESGFMRKGHRHSSLSESPLLVWGIAAAAYVLAAFCLVSLSWDGSYYLFETLRTGSPYVPHHRWFNWVLQSPVLWARGVEPVQLAILHSLACSLLPLFSLAASLWMLQEGMKRLRIWTVIGILLVPLPGLLPIVGEVTPTLQLSWVLFAFAWCGCPRRGALPAGLAALTVVTLHPAAAPLLFLAATITGVFASGTSHEERCWILRWAFFFLLLSIGKATESALLATPYERAHVSAAVWLDEMKSGLRYTAFPALLPLLIERVLALWMPATPLRLWLRRGLWALAFGIGLRYTLDPGLWSASINYRKFGLVVSLPVILLASLDAWRQRTHPSSREPIPAAIPALLFATLFLAMALGWYQLCGSLLTRLQKHPDPVMGIEHLPEPESYSALHHWSTASLSILLQGWEPTKLFLLDAKPQGEFLRICPDSAFRCEDDVFKLAWIATLKD